MKLTMKQREKLAFCTFAPSISLCKGQYFNTNVSQVYILSWSRLDQYISKWIKEEGDIWVTVSFLLLPQIEGFRGSYEIFRYLHICRDVLNLTCLDTWNMS